VTKRKTNKGGSSNGRTPVSKTGNGGSNPSPPAKSKGGRPSLYTPELVAAICERLGKGEALAAICRDDGMPATRTVRDWIEKMPEVSAAFACAREDGHDEIAARLRDVTRGGEGSSGDVQRDRLIVETDLKLLAKWNPKRYGDKVQLSDSEGGKLALPPAITVTFVDADADG
jgi:hypothetical protein